MNHLLIVEDHSTLAQSLKRTLESEGFQVSIAGNVQEARDRSSKNPDLVLLDWMLPDGQGLDLLKEIRRSNQKLPILLMTARTDLVDKVVGLEAGANDYITKPFELRELIARVRAHLRVVNSSQGAGAKTN